MWASRWWFGVHRCLRTCICDRVSRDDSCCERYPLICVQLALVDRLFPVEKLGEPLSLDSFDFFNRQVVENLGMIAMLSFYALYNYALCIGRDNAVVQGSRTYARRIGADGGALTRGCICSALCYVKGSERTLKKRGRCSMLFPVHVHVGVLRFLRWTAVISLDRICFPRCEIWPAASTSKFYRGPDGEVTHHQGYIWV